LNQRPAPSPAQAALQQVEAARYALLRRLAYPMRHQVVVHLQPIGMLTEVLERRLRAPAPDLPQVADGVTRINGLSKSAVADVLDLITWLAPPAGATVTLEDAAQEALALLRSNFSFRGLDLRSEVGGAPQRIGQSAVRMVLCGALLAVADTAEAPAQVVLAAEPGEDVVHLRITVRRTGGEGALGGELPYRPLHWSDVQALARAEDVSVERTDSGAALSFPTLD
jgi:hypothetical protein